MLIWNTSELKWLASFCNRFTYTNVLTYFLVFGLFCFLSSRRNYRCCVFLVGLSMMFIGSTLYRLHWPSLDVSCVTSFVHLLAVRCISINSSIFYYPIMS